MQARHRNANCQRELLKRQVLTVVGVALRDASWAQRHGKPLALVEPIRQHLSRDAGGARSFREAKPVGYQANGARIPGLLSWSRPTAVGWLVAARIVDSINRV